jgi:hypothetical protein
LVTASASAAAAAEDIPLSSETYTPIIRETRSPETGVKATEDLAWEKRSPEMPNEPSPRRNLFSILGVAALVVALLGVWYYFINRPNETFVETANETIEQNAPLAETSPIVETNAHHRARARRNRSAAAAAFDQAAGKQHLFSEQAKKNFAATP